MLTFYYSPLNDVIQYHVFFVKPNIRVDNIVCLSFLLLLLFVGYGLQDHPCKQICHHLSYFSENYLHSTFGSTAFLIQSSHRKHGLPNCLFPIGFYLITTLTNELSFLQTCPAHINIFLVISAITSGL